MTLEHPLWALLTLACLVWYSTITVVVTVRGWKDLRQMVGRLREGGESS